MSATLRYFHTKSDTEAARNLYNYAGSHLENARIKERLAEIESQHAPLSNLRGANRDEAYAVSFYVVVGRWPEGFEYMERKS